MISTSQFDALVRELKAACPGMGDFAARVAAKTALDFVERQKLNGGTSHTIVIEDSVAQGIPVGEMATIVASYPKPRTKGCEFGKLPCGERVHGVLRGRSLCRKHFDYEMDSPA